MSGNGSEQRELGGAERRGAEDVLERRHVDDRGGEDELEGDAPEQQPVA